MNRNEFLRRLEELLMDISTEEREAALDYYDSYFDDAGASEEDVIRQLGSPERVANTIKANLSLDAGADYVEVDERKLPEDTRDRERQSTYTDYSDFRSDSEEDRAKAAEAMRRQKRASRKLGLVLLLFVILVILAVIGGIAFLGKTYYRSTRTTVQQEAVSREEGRVPEDFLQVEEHGASEESAERNEDGSLMELVTASEIRTIDIEVGAAALVIAEADQGLEQSGQIGVQIEEDSFLTDVQVRQNGSTLIIEQKMKKHPDGLQLDHVGGKINIYLPAELMLNQIDMELGIGNITIQQNVHVKELDIDLSTGNVKIPGGVLVENESDIAVGIGNIEANSYAVNGELDLDIGMGDIDFIGSVERDFSVDVGTGNVTARIFGTPDSYNYDLEAGMGNIVLNGRKSGGAGTELHEKNSGAGRTIEMDAGIGNITLDVAE